MASTHRKRPTNDSGADDDESTDATGKHPKRGFSHWLWIAPPSCSFAEVAHAYKSHDSPHDVWPGGNHRIDEFDGGEQA